MIIDVRIELINRIISTLCPVFADGKGFFVFIENTRESTRIHGIYLILMCV